MTSGFQLFAHRWDPAGSGDAKSIQKAIGRSSLDLWNILLRESLQNSWDAREGNQISFRVSETELTTDQSSILVDDLFGELPPNGASRRLPHQLKHGRLRVLLICDTHTKGLGGPVRADVATPRGTRRDFVDFVRNFGRSEEKGLQGGTYGYGKGILYRVSSVGLCLVYSQTKIAGRIEPRLIGLSGGDPEYDHEGRKFTGRNWWGILASDGVADPLTGPDARDVAISVGMPVPSEDETGTCVMIMAPREVDDEREEAAPSARMEAIRDAAVKWAWPHAVDVGKGPSVSFFFSLDGIPLPPIVPLKEPSVRHFAQAYIDLERSSQTGQDPVSPQTKLKSIASQRPLQNLGTLAMRQAIPSLSDDEGLANTVALLRNPRIVVKYLRVASPPSEYCVYSVFVGDPSVDEDYASSEPVAHDDWVVDDAEKRGRRNFVRTALNRITATFQEIHSSQQPAVQTRPVSGAAKISTSLGGLVGGISGYGAASQPESPRPPGGPGGGGGSRRAAVRLAGPPTLLEVNDQPHVKFTYEVRGGKSGDRVQLRARAQVVIDGGATEKDDDAPFLASKPEFVAWSVGGVLSRDSVLSVSLPTDDRFDAIFTQPEDTAVRATVDLERTTK